MTEIIEQLTAELYDVSVPDWPGEIDFYRQLAAQFAPGGEPILEVACGTGRVALRLAQDGRRVVGLDLSAAMLEIARHKSTGLPQVSWVQGDLRTFDLGERFPLVISPGHSFQNMLTSADQLACLENLKRHLLPGGRLVIHLDHQDVAWLGSLMSGKGGVCEASNAVIHPRTARRMRAVKAWRYAPATQTATLLAAWEELDAQGAVIQRWERQPLPMHCVFRFEMEHLLARAGLQVEALYGDFLHGELCDDSTEMVWLIRNT